MTLIQHTLELYYQDHNPSVLFSSCVGWGKLLISLSLSSITMW